MDKSAYIMEASKCVRCGICKSFCPTYDVLRREGGSPRGRLSLVESRFGGEGGFKEAYVRHMKECTLCGACYSNCPNGVNVPELVLAARAEIVEKEGMTFPASFVLKNFLASEKLMPLALRFASKLQGLFFKGAGEECGLLSRFNLPVVGDGRLLPELSERFFLDRKHVKALSTEARREGKGGAAKVAFYAGCGINYFLPDIGEATIRLLKEGGADIIVPQGQVCCGMPAFSAGDRETAKSLAIKNIEAFEETGADFIVTSCATCGHGLKNVFRVLLSTEGPEIRSRVERFVSKVRDITELLTHELPYKGGVKEGNRNLVVTYHDPCHLRRYQGVSEQPRRLLAACGAGFKGLKHPCRCCGLGGGLSLENY
ncbi:MAG: (Fe-S)-binding protein [Deltaproteobacteria bacterium]|nr:(Fe-S)-binding protein [Deltaproteobacteria bacterium]